MGVGRQARGYVLGAKGADVQWSKEATRPVQAIVVPSSIVSHSHVLSHFYNEFHRHMKYTRAKPFLAPCMVVHICSWI